MRVVQLDGRSLRLDALVAHAAGSAGSAGSGAADEPVTCAPHALDGVERAHGALVEAGRRGRVYGLSTGVGANRSQDVPAPDAAAHALRLLRSHAVGVGPLEDERVTRAALLARLNQLLAGGSGVSRPVVAALGAAVACGAVPELHVYGSIGTGDLSPMAELALTLVGERPWRSGALPPVRFAPTDAMPFLSSGALTLASAGLAAADLVALLRAAHVVAALSSRALRGSLEPYAEVVFDAEPSSAGGPPEGAGARTSAALMRRLLAGSPPAARLQDPFALRVLPQVHGTASDAVAAVVRQVEQDLNRATENPLVVRGTAQVLHHGQFYAAALTAALDATRAALQPVLALSAARLTALLDPRLTGLPAFLAHGPAGSSGAMLLEYVAQDALAEVRLVAGPAGLAPAVLSRGLEEVASFATQSARALRTGLRHAPYVLACELVAAVRALRAEPERAGGGRLAAVFELSSARLPVGADDRSLGPDLTVAVALLPELARHAVAGFA